MGRNLELDGIRGYSCLIIIIYHSLLFLKPGPIPPFLITFQQVTNFNQLLSKISTSILNGQLGVVFFFILSGVVLFKSIHNKQQEFFPTIINFTLKRTARIYPALIGFLILFFLIFKMLHLLFPSMFFEISYKNLINNILLYNSNMAPCTWTLRVEMLAIPFIIFSFYLFKFSGAIALFIILGYSFAIYDNAWLAFNLPLINNSLLLFAFGFFIPTQIGKQIFSFFKAKHSIPLLLLALVVKQFIPYDSTTGVIVQSMFAFLVVGILYHHQSGALHKILTTKFALYFGKISYSLYLFNVIFLTIYCQILLHFTMPFKHFIAFGLLTGLLTIITTTPFAHFSEKYIERTFVKLNSNFLQNLYSRRKISSYPLAMDKE